MLEQVLAAAGTGGALAFAGLALWLAIGRGSARTRVATLDGDVARGKLQLRLAVAEHAAYQRHVAQQLAAKEQTIDAYDSLLGLAASAGGDPRALLAALVLPGQGDDGPGSRAAAGVPAGATSARLAAVSTSVLGPKPRRGMLGRLAGAGGSAVDGARDNLDP